MPARKTTGRRAPRTKRMAALDMNPMSLLQMPDEPKPEPTPGPQKMGCSNCGAFPFGAHRLMMIMGALVLVLSTYVVIASMRLNVQDLQLSAFNMHQVPSLASR